MSEQFPTEPLTGDPDRADSPGAADAPTTSWWQTVVPFAVIACVLLTLLFATLVVVSGPVFFAQPTPAPDERNPGPKIPDVPQPDPTNSAAETARVAELRAEETQAIRSAKLEQFTTARDQTKEDLANLATEMASWNNLTTELLDGDGGKHIASDVVYIQRFLPIHETEYVTQPQYESFQRRFLSLSEPVDKAKKDATYLPSENLLSELQALRNEVSSALAKLESARKDAQAIKSFAASRPPSDKPLRAAIEDFRQQQQQARLDQVAEAKRLAELETTNMLAEKEAEQEKFRREVELARLASKNDELRASKRQLDAEAKEAEARRLREEAKAALVRQFEAEYPGMKSMLTPFTSTGTRQPTTSFQYIDTGERKPVSFGALQRLGYLENSPQNRLYFAKYVTALNNRPTGSFPNLSLDSGGGHEKIRKIQEFLQKYGEIMVEKELLSP